MRPAEYETMFRLEDTYWWYAGLMQLVLATLDELGDRRAMRILDAGCGTGGVLDRLRGSRSLGVEIAEPAIRLCRRRGLDNVVQSSVTTLPFREGSFDAVVSLDVLCHEWVADDVGALTELRRVLAPRGVLLLQMPAFRLLRGEHDAAVMSPRRYTRHELERKLRTAGLDPLRVTYRNTALFPVALAVRMLRRPRVGREHKSDLFPLPLALNAVLRGVLTVENAVLRRVRLPFGLSVFCVARRP